LDPDRIDIKCWIRIHNKTSVGSQHCFSDPTLRVEGLCSFWLELRTGVVVLSWQDRLDCVVSCRSYVAVFSSVQAMWAVFRPLRTMWAVFCPVRGMWALFSPA
jgi:hypothetical protein